MGGWERAGERGTRNGGGEGETTRREGGCSSKGEGEGRTKVKQDGGVEEENGEQREWWRTMESAT